jgi:hypothetical protein
MGFLWTAFSGWAVGLLLAAGITLPYLARSLRWSSLLPHYGLGLLVPLAATLHASLPMSLLRIGRFNATGLLLATGALVLIIWQAGLGVALRSARGTERRKLKRIHFGTMTIVVALVAGHIALNRA